MKAVVLHEYGGPEKLTFEDNVPEPQVSGDTVLIAATAASVNPIDWKIRSGMRQKDFPLSFPAILGRDVSGIVRAVGANVKHFKPGDRVLALSNATYAELVAVDDSDVTHLPDGVDLTDAAAIPLIAVTGDQLVRHATNVQKGQVVLILEDAIFEQNIIELQPGDVLLAYTDGISEAMNAAEEEWGEETMLQVARKLINTPGCAWSAESLVECLFREADGFTAGAPQHDDMTVVVCAVQ